MTPQLAVCVPTHDGRARGVDELLTRLAAEPGIEDVQVCISDNGSTDGTADVVARHRGTFGERLRYSRNDGNLGMAENMLRVVELSDADYCWLMGSDDAPARGSLGRVRTLLDDHAGVTGLALGLMRVDAHDLELPGHVVVPDPFPPQRAVTRFRGKREVAESLGYVTYFTSSNVIHRHRWQAVVDAERGRALRAGSGPHLYVTARMAARDPDWVWCPQPLVLSREAELYLADTGEGGHNNTSIVRVIFADLDRIWASVYGRYSYAHRALMFRALRHMWNREAIFALRREAQGPRELLTNLACARRLWWSRRFWRHHLPALVMPVFPLRYTERCRRPFATRPIPAGDRMVMLDGTLPEAMTAGYACWVTVRIQNLGNVSLSSAGPYPVRLATRWRDAASGASIDLASVPATLWPPLRPRSSRLVEQLVIPPWEPGTYTLNVTAAQAEVGRFDAAHRDSALESTVRVDCLPD
jgi:glycosyltransferase involved in cell wall biosynthesis